ncbi:MAG: glutathione peroxidase [SAR86 cluster bacterium]|nr:MAG: glutathione peroxidase [SAR86 cluster bacterium]|tara:strand:- start:646 stop:1128 length:483 start_codon:yes stop_codon:yes gene_type:complete
MKESFYDFKANDIAGNEVLMSDYKNKVVLIVNVASACYFTPQYKGMEKLYKSFKEKGFEVLGFPCNQFAEEEKGTNEEILNFCTSQFDVSFPMFEKIEVNGTNAHPLFKFLKKAVKGFLGSESIKWNFSKFLVDQSGNVVKRYGSLDAPEAIEGDVKNLL